MTLYRKYRPQNFSELLGQNHIRITLQNEIENNDIAHAYLFCGPRAVGKTTISRVFAKAINCLNRQNEEYEPCNKCEMCLDITAGKSLDVVEIDAASHTGVDNVRNNIIEVAQVAPSRAKYKVFIIDEVHMLSISAFNALLKLLEEPPTNVIFILCTTEVHKIPATIISRCQRFDFKKIVLSEIVKKLSSILKKEGIECEKSVLETIARQSEGHMRDAESLLGQVISISGEKITADNADLIIPRGDLIEAIKFIRLLSEKKTSEAITLVNKIINDGIDIKIFLKDLIELLRKIMLSSISPNLSVKFGLELGESMEKDIDKIIKNTDVRNIINWIDKLIEVQKNISGSFIIQLPLEIAIVELCSGFTENVSRSNPPSSKNTEVDDKKNIVDQKPAKIINPKSISSKEVNSKWTKVLSKIKEENPSLLSILQACKPSEINNGQINLSFKYSFHKKKIDEVKIKSILENVLSDIYSSSIIINTEIDNSIKILRDIDKTTEEKKEEQKVPEKNEIKKGENDNSDDDMINNLLKTFGGKVVG